MDDKQKILNVLHDLVATCNDAAEGYAKAAKGVHESSLSDWLAQASADRERFADDLSREIAGLGGSPGADLHEGGILHKGWVDLEQSMRSNAEHLHSKDDKEILRECIAGDSGSLPHYDHALEQKPEGDLRMLLLTQRTNISDDLAYMETRVQRH